MLMSKQKTMAAIVALMFILFAATNPALAMDGLDLSVGLKTLPLLKNKLPSNAVLAIIYDPKFPASVAEAQAINNNIDGGFEAPGGVRISALMVSVNELSKLSEAKIGIVTTGSATQAVGAATANYGILTMSSDIECVKAHLCVLGIVSRPNVEIHLSETAADAAKIGFSPAFIMLAKLE